MRSFNLRASSTRLSFAAMVFTVATATLSAQTIIGGNIFDGSGGPLLAGTVYHTTGAGISVPAGETLTIEAGAIIKLPSSDRVEVLGTLIANGTSADPIILTSIFDDTAGGDTNADGPSTGNAGDWRQVRFEPNSDASVLDHVMVRFAGQIFAEGGINLNQADITMNDCTVEQCDKEGVDFNNNSFPTIENLTLTGNDRPTLNVTWAMLPNIRHVTATGHAVGDYIRVRGNVEAETVEVYPYNYPGDVLVMNNIRSTVRMGGSLTLGAGVIIKFENLGGLQCEDGILNLLGTGLEPIVFTGIADDDIAGDTNNDGNASSPAPGTWTNLRYTDTALTSTCSHVVIRYGGFIPNVPFTCDSDQVTVESVRVDHSQRNGITITALAGDLTNCTAWDCAGDGFRLISGAYDVINCTSVGNADAGFATSATNGHTGNLINCIGRNNTTTEAENYSASQISHSNVDAAFAGSNGNISADPLFTDEANGDFTLQAGSPCIDAGLSPTGSMPVRDARDGSRDVDADLSGTHGTDMGAHEATMFDLGFTGQPQTDTTMTFVPSGPAGTLAVIILGTSTDTDTQAVSTYGYLLVGTASSATPLAFIPTGQSFVVDVPNMPSLEGFEFGLQALGVLNGPTVVGAFTNTYRGRIFN